MSSTIQVRVDDDLKVKSCMTLFDIVSNNDIFNKVLEKFYNGTKDELTISICNLRKQIKTNY